MSEPEKKPPWAMPTPPPHIQKIIDRLDAREDLTEDEHQKLGDWEDSVGGFGGLGL